MNEHPTDTPICLACQRSEQEVPLIPIRFQGTQRWICPQHLPVLIHQPDQLAGVLPGAERLEAADHHDD